MCKRTVLAGTAAAAGAPHTVSERRRRASGLAGAGPGKVRAGARGAGEGRPGMDVSGLASSHRCVPSERWLRESRQLGPEPSAGEGRCLRGMETRKGAAPGTQGATDGLKDGGPKAGAAGKAPEPGSLGGGSGPRAP